jgi:hypothetical protein
VWESYKYFSCRISRKCRIFVKINNLAFRAFRFDAPWPEKVNRFHVRDKNEAHPGILAVILTGLFPGGGISVFLAMHTFVTLDTLFGILVLSGGLTLAVYYILRRQNRRYFLEMAGFSFIGVGGLMVAISLAVNYFFYHDMKTTTITENLNRNSPAGAVLAEDSSYKNFPYLLYFEDLEEDSHRPVREINITTATGLLGYRIVLNREIVYQ